MMTRPFFSVAALTFVAALTTTVSAMAHEYKLGSIEIQHPWTRATAEGAANGAAYMVLKDTGKEADRLVGASTPAAGRAELHTHLMEDGVMKMREVEGGIPVKPGEATTLAPGGYHIMLMELKGKLVKGENIPMTLVFEKAGKIDVELKVEAAGETGKGGMGHDAAGHGGHKMQ